MSAPRPADLERALERLRTAPPRPTPAICRACTRLGTTAAGDPVHACQGDPGCAIDAALADDAGRQS